ncbi:MAG: NADH:ubiquinone oxidoreductase [Gemmatimonadetes bacterium]|nr:NADH:ubiquinone oxidoreductase [Gemmatimonadota bacterium]
MNGSIGKTVQEVCRANDYDPHRMMDIVRGVQEVEGYVSGEAMEWIAATVGSHRVEVESVVSFYSFFTDQPQGRIVIRLCDDIVDRMAGSAQVEQAFVEQLGIQVGETTPDGAITLTRTACIGMCDQAPAALINDVVVTSLNSDRVRDLVRGLRDHMDPARLIWTLGDGNNDHNLVQAMVHNNIRQRGQVILAEDIDLDQGLQKALAMTPTAVIRAVNNARLRGRGGAGFPVGMKWQFTRDAEGERKFIICNADEGEPGTFKDRVILTERAELMVEGMTIGAYAIGASEGLIYLRGEYAYLRPYLDNVLQRRRAASLLGQNIHGLEGFHFDIRIQLGAGSYVCGEETALISSCEGRRGDPTNRPPFPAQHGYLGCPTAVNNVETFCCVARILDRGPGWFASMGSSSTGTKLLSVAGDCRSPGVYEVEFGTSLGEILRLVGAEDAQAVQMGGPSGQMVGPADYGREICYDDLATGGSVMVFGPERNLLEVVRTFLEFFIDESCGYCTPCRVGNRLLGQGIDKVMASRVAADDVAQLEELAMTVKNSSRCGLGQTSPNPVMSTLKNFRDIYEDHTVDTAGKVASFDLEAALGEATAIAGRSSVHNKGLRQGS